MKLPHSVRAFRLLYEQPGDRHMHINALLVERRGASAAAIQAQNPLT